MSRWTGSKQAVSATAPATIRRFTVEMPPDLARMWGVALQGGAVTRAQCLSVPAVVSGLQLTAGTLATLPWHVLSADGGQVPSSLMDQPDPDVARVVTLRETLDDLAIEGSSAWLVLARDSRGYPTRARHLTYGSWQVDDRGVVRVDSRTVPADDVKIFTSPSPRLRDAAARGVRTAIAAEDAAQRMAANPLPLGIFTQTDSGPSVDPDELAEFLTEFEAARGQNEYTAIPAALRFERMSLNANEMALSELRNLASVEISRCFSVSPEWIGTSTTSRTYANAEQQRRDLVDLSLMAPLRTAVEQRLSMADITPRGQRVRCNLDAFLRGSTIERYTAHKMALDAGWRSVDEVRALEDLGPMGSA